MATPKTAADRLIDCVSMDILPLKDLEVQDDFGFNKFDNVKDWSNVLGLYPEMVVIGYISSALFHKSQVEGSLAKNIKKEFKEPRPLHQAEWHRLCLGEESEDGEDRSHTDFMYKRYVETELLDEKHMFFREIRTLTKSSWLVRSNDSNPEPRKRIRPEVHETRGKLAAINRGYRDEVEVTAKGTDGFTEAHDSEDGEKEKSDNAKESAEAGGHDIHPGTSCSFGQGSECNIRRAF